MKCDGRRPPRGLVRRATALFPLLGAALAMVLFGRGGVAYAQTSQVRRRECLPFSRPTANGRADPFGAWHLPRGDR